jgi:hypothetical protein
MKGISRLAGCLLAVAPSLPANGHGTPIRIDVTADQLVVSNGWADLDGFAAMIFGEDDEDGEPFASLVLPQVGPVIVWQLPGLDIADMDDQSSLSIEVLPRPARDTSSLEERVVWYWHPESELVSAAPAGFHLLGSEMRSTTLPPIASDAQEPFMLANPVAGQQGFHNHGLISYALDNDPPPPPGLYGFFARFTSDRYVASDPFLIVFNHDVEPLQVQSAGIAINAAAFLPGDYNHDDRVDAADYELWRASFGRSVLPFNSADGSGNGLVDAADYAVWRQGFGQPAAGALATATVPEATMPALFCTAVIAWGANCSFRRPKIN